MTVPLTLDPASIEAVARRVAELLRDETPTQPGALTADEVAERLGVSRDHVYRHAAELGGKRMGDGPRARLRFPVDAINRYLAIETPEAKPTRRQRRSGPRSNVELLPVKGRKAA